MLKHLLVATGLLFAANLAAQSLPTHIGPGNHFVNLSHPSNAHVVDLVETTYGAATNGTSLNGFFDGRTCTEQQKAFLLAIAMKEHGLKDPSKVTPAHANRDGDFIGGVGMAKGPFQMWPGFVYDATERNAGLNCRINDLDQTGLGGPKGWVNTVNWNNCAWVGSWADPGPWSYEQLMIDMGKWWGYNCGLAVLYYDRYCGSAWEDLNSDDPAVTAAAVEELSKTHNGGPNAPGLTSGPVYNNVTSYHNDVVNILSQSFSGVISGF